MMLSLYDVLYSFFRVVRCFCSSLVPLAYALFSVLLLLACEPPTNGCSEPACVYRSNVSIQYHLFQEVLGLWCPLLSGSCFSPSLRCCVIWFTKYIGSCPEIIHACPCREQASQAKNVQDTTRLFPGFGICRDDCSTALISRIFLPIAARVAGVPLTRILRSPATARTPICQVTPKRGTVRTSSSRL